MIHLQLATDLAYSILIINYTNMASISKEDECKNSNL